MVDGIREELRFKCQTLAEIQRFAAFAYAFAVEEVATLELQAHLITPYLPLTTALRFGKGGAPRISLRVALVDNPVVVVTFRVFQLLIINRNIVSDAMFFAEIERRVFHTAKFTISNQLIVDGGHVTRVDL